MAADSSMGGHLLRLCFQFGELSRSPYASVMLVTFVLFMVLVPILLLNMLIAMMGNTYATVVQQSEKEWVKQVTRAGLVFGA